MKRAMGKGGERRESPVLRVNEPYKKTCVRAAHGRHARPKPTSCIISQHGCCCPQTCGFASQRVLTERKIL
jgi:hypothetical protein